MNTNISVQNLNKHFELYQKQEGLWASVKGIFSREYKTLKAVDDVSFEIKQGEMVGFIGPNGAGKTTTLKMLSGLLYPTSGEISVLGFHPYERKNVFLKQISLVMGQKNQLWWDLPAVESFLLNKEIYEVSTADYKRVSEELFDLLELQDIIHQQVRRLSLGQRMKCELVAALIHSPRILFLDEPTIGLDILTQKKLRKFIKEYNKRFGATVMLTSHYMEDVKEICERIILINKGKVLFDGPLTKLEAEYGQKKNVTIGFNKKVEEAELSKYGEIIEYNPLKVTLAVSRTDVPQISSALLAKYDVDDLDIAEVKLEDIVAKYF